MKLFAAMLGLTGLLALLTGGGDREAAEAANKARAPLEQRLTQRGFTPGAPVYIRVFKAEDRLEVWMADGARHRLFETYPICRWSGALGPKLKEGDGQAPEGFYAITPKQLNPNSAYHLAFNTGFPNAYDRANKRTGSALMVHGDCKSIGCYAMTDKGIDDIYALMTAAFAKGQKAIPLDALPFRLTPANLKAHDTPKWNAFWADLAHIDGQFVATGRPPAVYSCKARYAVTTGPGCVVVRP